MLGAKERVDDVSLEFWSQVFLKSQPPQSFNKRFVILLIVRGSAKNAPIRFQLL
jgi:hypothetical protein